MKVIMILLVILSPRMIIAQQQEIQQLLLNVEKLSQLKRMLQDMKHGYTILYKGYNVIKNISSGQFTLHKTFLDGLMEVSPAVKKYRRIGEIIRYQQAILEDHRKAIHQIRQEKLFAAEEVEHFTAVWTAQVQRSVKSIEELLLVITAGRLRMSDAERIEAIDRIYSNVSDQYQFIKVFTAEAKLLLTRRQHEQTETEYSKKIIGLP